MLLDSSISADLRPPIVEQTGGKNTTGTLDLIKIGTTVEVRIIDFSNLYLSKRLVLAETII